MIRWQSEDVMKCFKKVDMIRVSPYQQIALVDQLCKVTFRGEIHQNQPLTSKAREKRPGDEVDKLTMSTLNRRRYSAGKLFFLQGYVPCFLCLNNSNVMHHLFIQLNHENSSFY